MPHKQTTGILAISGRGGSRTALPLPRGLAPSPITVGAAPHRTHSSPIPQRPSPHAIPRRREESRAPITYPLPPSVVLASRSCPREDGGRGPIPPPSPPCTPLPPPRCISLPKEQTTGAFANSGRGGSRTALPLPRGLAPSPITVGAAPHRTHSSPIPQRPPPHAIPRRREESRAPITDPLPPSVVLASRSCPREDGGRGPIPPPSPPWTPYIPSNSVIELPDTYNCLTNKPPAYWPSLVGAVREPPFPLPRGLAPSPITVGAGFKPAPHRTHPSLIPVFPAGRPLHNYRNAFRCRLLS